MVLGKRGVAPQVIILIAIALAVTIGVGILFFTGSPETVSDTSTNSLTGAITGLAVAGIPGDGSVGAATITECNITVSENITNIGHDYECTGANGFIIGADAITVDCQNHSIRCMGEDCDNQAGFINDGYDDVTIQNCRIFNFSDGMRLFNNASRNLLTNNLLENNTDGIDLYDAPSNNVTLSTITNNTACGINVSGLTHDVSATESYNRIWNNFFYAVDISSSEACNDPDSFTYWNLEKTCTAGSNILGGPCLGGNFWETYIGKDITGDGLGDSNIPYQDGSILATSVGDGYPLVDPCDMPGVISEDTTCDNRELDSDTGEGLAITSDNVYFECNGTVLDGNRSSDGEPGDFAEDMRGIEIVGVNNVTVVGCTIHDFKYGIYISNSYNVTLIGNDIHNNQDTGIFVTSLSYNINITDNNITNNNHTETNSQFQQYGVRFVGSYPGTSDRESWITNNSIQNSTVSGVRVYSSSDYVEVWNNTFSNNTQGLEINDSAAASIRYNIFLNNSVGLALDSATSVASFGTYGESSNNFTNNTYGIYARGSTADFGITGSFTGNDYGIYFYDTSIDITQIDSVNDSLYGIFIEGSSGNIIGGAEINGTGNPDNSAINGTAIYLYASTDISFGTLPIDLNNNLFGIYLEQTNESDLSYTNYQFGDNSFILNNNVSIVIDSSLNNNISGLNIVNNTIGIEINGSSSGNIIYNNNFTLNIRSNGSSGNGVDTTGLNHWNSGKSTGTNIIGGANIAGNFWDSYIGTDTTGDGIGDSSTPHTSNDSIFGLGGDEYPLVGTGNATCSSITHDTTLSSNVSQSLDGATCFTINTAAITLDCAGYSIIGTQDNFGVSINDVDNVTVLNCEFTNLSIGINASNADGTIIYNNSFLEVNSSNEITTAGLIVDASYLVNISGNIFSQTTPFVTGGDSNYSIYLNVSNSTVENNTIKDSYNSIIFSNGSNNNTIHSNTIKNNTFGIIFDTLSENNTIYNNIFNNTNGPTDTSTNFYNTSYNCDSGANILGGSCIGGNLWASNYSGADDGSGVYPYNESDDGIGDTNIPFNFTNLPDFTGDFLPLANVPLSCSTITSSTTLSEDISANGDCFIIQAHNITLDFNN